MVDQSAFLRSSNFPQRPDGFLAVVEKQKDVKDLRLKEMRSDQNRVGTTVIDIFGIHFVTCGQFEVGGPEIFEGISARCTCYTGFFSP